MLLKGTLDLGISPLERILRPAAKAVQKETLLNEIVFIKPRALASKHFG
jgi:hypothetical protein